MCTPRAVKWCNDGLYAHSVTHLHCPDYCPQVNVDGSRLDDGWHEHYSSGYAAVKKCCLEVDYCL